MGGDPRSFSLDSTGSDLLHLVDTIKLRPEPFWECAPNSFEAATPQLEFLVF
jgi:hypothetical protein